MKKNTDRDKEISTIDDLEEFYLRKKRLQEALKRLLKALDERSVQDYNKLSE